MLGLYLHIPFCSSICSYCNFNRGLFDGPLKARYVDAIEAEIRAAGDGRAADTIFFGGGTPSLLDPPEIARLIAACRSAYALSPDAEITLEANPETASPDRLEAFREAGVNRVSFGVQSFDDEELARLGRMHSARRAAEAVAEARAAGFTNLSFDLMLWLPGQSLASWARTVERAVALAPDHLSLYLLELYPNAPLKESMAAPAPGFGGGAGAWAQAPTTKRRTCIWPGSTPRRGRLRAVRDLERRASRLFEPPQRQVLAERRLARVRVRRAFDGRRRPLEERRRDGRLCRTPWPPGATSPWTGSASRSRRGSRRRCLRGCA